MNYSLLRSTLFLQISLLLHLCAASDTISGDQTLRNNGSVLVSQGGIYVLGFFKPVKSNSTFLGIWFKFSSETVVWVANRNNPIGGALGVLSLSRLSQNLVLSDGENASLWTTGVGSKSGASSVEARILDTGNLVLRRDGEIVWQSFDHPTNVLLSGMKVGLNRRTGLDREITAWKSPNDPGSGNCTLRMDTAGSAQLMLYKNRTKWWRAGHWNGAQWSGVPALGALPERNIFNITFADNSDEVTVMWNVLEPSIFPYVFVDPAGFIRQYAWQAESRKWVEIYAAPGDNCDKYARCGVFGSCYPYNLSGYECNCLPGYQPVSRYDWDLQDGSGGCRKGDGAASMCGAGEGFVTLKSIKVPDASAAVVDRNLGLRECREECLKNCSCLAYTAADVRKGGTGCMRWYGGVTDTKQFLEGGQDFYLRVDKFELAKYKKSGGLSGKWIAAIVVVAVFAGFTVVVSVLCWLKRTRKAEKKIILGQPSLSYDARASSTGIKGLSRENSTDKSDICFFELSTIVVATDNFSLANKLGQGGFGAVYKGVLSNGEELAVKRLSRFSGQGTEEFKNEVVLIAKLQHRNLVKLLGCCIHDEEKMLIYEFMPNKSLDLVLFDKNKKSLLVWRQRSTIIFGIARGLLYLHQDSRLKIIHRDLKASNVLLDATMTPKISDFGMARMFGDDQIEANTNKVVGTYGYMSPEYAMEGLYSIKSDVFSFGVLTLEIITGKKNSNFNEVSSLNLVGQVWDLWKEEKALEIVDESLDTYPVNQVLRWIQIGLLCVQELAVDRPSMLEVMFMLGNETPLPSAKRPAFIYKNSSSDTTTSKGYSVNDVTVTVMEPR